MSNATHDRRGDVNTLPDVDPSLASGDDLAPGARARCVDCLGILVAKCGEINRWHWAHEAANSQCVGSDGESAWHFAWKAWAEQYGADTEVTDGQHRADIIWADGHVYELQSDYLEPAKIRNREHHWGEHLTWIYRITPGRFGRLSNIGEGWFRWNRPAVSMTRHQRPIIWHLNDRLYETTVELVDEEVRVRFAPGERDKYGPVLYGSRPAPFDVADARSALRQFKHFAPASREVS